MSPALAVVLLVAAGTVAGVVGTAGGITSLVSYPALLAAGVPPLPANVANIVALVVCGPGSALASGPELAGRGRWLWRWSWVAAAGGAAGAVLLLCTPPGDFARVVPFLVALGSLALLAQPRLAARYDGRARHGTLILLPGLLLVTAYGGYFGAGSGVMTLALLLFTVDQHLARANALKNMVIGAGVLASALTLIVAGPVDWAAVGPLAVGLFIGSQIGPRLARRIPAGVLRWLVVLLGLALAVKLWIAPG
ncbi:MAG TPA: sulfite exporter TauE/SafE family protein [Streptosporangiaceae bacterium]|jgi:hypothetical protein